jgi:delta(3,5)-delta(2,4)-dienoyl-CoA isomerase
VAQEVDVGLAADIGTLAHLPKITSNNSLARELAYTARTFSAAEAVTLGLVSKVVEGGRDGVVKAALGLAEFIARKSPVAVTSTKQLLIHSRDHSVPANLEYTSIWNGVMLHTAVWTFFPSW